MKPILVISISSESYNEKLETIVIVAVKPKNIKCSVSCFLGVYPSSDCLCQVLSPLRTVLLVAHIVKRVFVGYVNCSLGVCVCCVSSDYLCKVLFIIPTALVVVR